MINAIGAGLGLNLVVRYYRRRLVRRLAHLGHAIAGCWVCFPGA